MSEKMRVLDMLENGKINAQEAAQLLDSLGKSRVFDREQREQVEEKFQRFAQDVTCFAKDVGEKAKEMYKNVEPKIKKASQSALEKAAAALDELACTIHESLEKVDKTEGSCEEGTCSCCPKEN
jgi:polyhydroxyalkanoate synthesis regulator phasin